MRKAALLLLLLVAVYLLAFPISTKPEIYFAPARMSGLDATSNLELDNDQQKYSKLHHFVLGDIFGYVSDSGIIQYQDRKMYRVAMDDARFINFSSVSGNLVIQSFDGEVIDAIEIRGYPILLDGRIFIISTNRGEFGEIDVQGSYLWKYEFTSPITEIDAKHGHVMLGLLDGRVLIYDRNGIRAAELLFDQSRVSAIYGCALSADATRIAVIHGIDPQILSVYRLVPGRKLIYETALSDPFRSHRRIFFLAHGDFLLADAEGAVAVVDLEKAEMAAIPAAGRIVGTLNTESLTYVLMQDDEKAEIIVISLPPAELARTTFLAEHTSILGSADYIILGMDRHLGKIETFVR